MNDTAKLLEKINLSEKYIVSESQPKIILECPWLHVYYMKYFSGKSNLSDDNKQKLLSLTPLILPVTTHSFNCPIEDKLISIGLHYYDLSDWVINSACIHYIVCHNIWLPDSLVDSISKVRGVSGTDVLSGSEDNIL